MASLEAQARELGIPMKVAITDDIRYSDCDAHMADLVAIEGTEAVYRGECDFRHEYQQRFEIEELQQSLQIIGGQIAIGSGKGYKATGLEEY